MPVPLGKGNEDSGDEIDLRTAPSFATAHTFCASRDPNASALSGDNLCLLKNSCSHAVYDFARKAELSETC